MSQQPAIYLISWTNNPYFYIGQAQSFNKRKSTHLSRLNNRNHSNSKLQNVANKYGEPQFHIIEECEISELNDREQFYLDLLFDEPDCLNLAKYVDAPMRGLKLSLEHKQNVSKSKKGKKLSKEHKQKISEALRGENNPNFGKKYSPETIQKMSEAKKGKKRSEETIQKIAKATSKPVLQCSKDGDFIKEWGSAKEAAETLGIHAGHISSCCKGKLKSAGGFIWSYSSS